MKNHFIRNRCLAGAWMVAVMVLSASAAHAQSAAAGATKYANTCASCHGAPPGAIKPSVHKASANAVAIPHYLQGDADIAAFVPPDRPEVYPPGPGSAPLAANSATLTLRPGRTIIVASYTVSCTGGGATKTATGAATPGGGASSITVTGLTASTAYNCSATATNSSGTGLASAPVSTTTNAAAGPPPPPPTPIVKIRLMKPDSQGGGEVQCPVQYSSSNPPRWFIKVSASLPISASGFMRSGLPRGAKFLYLYKVNGYWIPGSSPGDGIFGPSPLLYFIPPARNTYNFEVFAQAWLNEKAISLVSSGVISCKVQ